MRPLIILLSLASLLAAGCGRDLDVEAVIADNVEQRMVEYRRILDANCRRDVIIEATRIADSIMLDRVRQLRDTSQRPPRPFRPGEPIWQTLPDTLELKPLFDTLPKGRDSVSR